MIIMSKQTIIKGTLILTITGILTKCLGFYNRIFLTRLIGVKELGTYQLIFPLYILGISFCCQGIATTITKHVSYLLGKKKYSDTRRALCFGGFLSFVLSLLVSACFFFGCDFIAMHILKNTDCRILLRSGSICRHKSLHQCIFYRTWKTGFLRKLPVDRTDYTDWFRLPSCHLLYAGSCWRQNGCTRCCDRRDGRHILRGQLLYLVPKKAESSEQIAR